VSRRRSLQVRPRDASRLAAIRALKAAHPFWGDRRLWAYLRCLEPWPIHKQRLWRLMREHHLLVRPTLQRKAKRPPTRSNPRPTKPNEWGGLDRTKVLVEGCGGVSSVVVLDWSTKALVGSSAGGRAPAHQWLAALAMAVNRQCPDGARGPGLSLMSDKGCQPTSLALMAACSTLGSQPAVTSDNTPKGNADTARVRRTLKEECWWLNEWTSPFRLSRALERWVTYDNEHDLHASLGSSTPRPFELEDQRRHSAPFAAA
jgi:putative transposase